MEQKNILNITTREDFRKWLIQNHNTELQRAQEDENGICNDRRAG